MQRLRCDVTGDGVCRVDPLRAPRCSPCLPGCLVGVLRACCGPPTALVLQLRQPRSSWDAGMDARQPVPEGIRGVDVDDIRSWQWDSLRRLGCGWPSHPDNYLYLATADRVFRPATAAVRAITRFSRTPRPFDCTVASHVGRGDGKGREAVCRLMLAGQPKICFVRSKLVPSSPRPGTV